MQGRGEAEAAQGLREEGASGRSRFCITEAWTWALQQVRLERGGREGEWGACLGAGHPEAGACKLRAPGRLGDVQDAGKKGEADSGI